MCPTLPALALSAPYRQAQRSLAQWLEGDRTAARRQTFAVRAFIGALTAGERHGLSRWLAWLCVAGAGRGEAVLERIQRLDLSLGASTEKALSYLPVGMVGEALRNYRKSA